VTRYRLAKLSGVSEAYIYRIERGEIKNPRRDTLEKLANGLNVTLPYLMGEPDPLDTLRLVELSLKAYIPVYAGIGEDMEAVDYVACTRAQVPPPTLRAYVAAAFSPSMFVKPRDIVVVDTALRPGDGDLVIVTRNGEASVRKYRKDEEGHIWLEDGRRRHGLEDAVVHGVVTEIVRKLR